MAKPEEWEGILKQWELWVFRDPDKNDPKQRLEIRSLY
jgi:hypothetical protein